MGRLMPRTTSAVLGGLPFTSADYCDFRTHGPHMKIDDLSVPSGRFIARHHRRSLPRPWAGLPAADSDFASVFTVPTEVGTGSAEAPAAATAVAQPTPSRRPTQGVDSVETTGPTASAPASPGSPAPPTVKPSSDRISTRTRRRTATAAGATPPALDYGFGPGGAPRPSARRANTPSRVPRPRTGSTTAVTPDPAASPVPTVPIPTATAQSLWELLCYGLRLLLATHRLHLPSWTPLATLLNCSLLIPSRVSHMPIGSDNSRRSRRATPQCVTSPSAGRRPCQPTFCRANPSHNQPPLPPDEDWCGTA